MAMTHPNAVMRALGAWADLYVDGFRRMTWGRTLWVLILAKLVILFLVMRLIFFRPYHTGADSEVAEAVGTELVERGR